jgi:hypothetical protein
MKKKNSTKRKKENLHFLKQKKLNKKMVDTEENLKKWYLTCVLVYYCKDQEQKYYLVILRVRTTWFN